MKKREERFSYWHGYRWDLVSIFAVS